MGCTYGEECKFRHTGVEFDTDIQGLKLRRKQKDRDSLRMLHDKEYLGKPCTNLFVFHAPDEWDDDDLVDCFSQYGEIVRAALAKDGLGRCRGYGFVKYKTQAEADSAVENLNRVMIGNKVLKVQYKKP